MESRKTLGKQLLDGIGVLLRGLRSLVGWGLEELAVTLNLFRNVPTMFIELALAIVFILAYLFPSEEIALLIARIGTGLAVPFVLGVFYSALNFIWVISHQERDAGWYYGLVKASLFPAIQGYLIFSNRAVQQFIGWGDEANTLRFCVFLVWGVVLVNVGVVQLAARIGSERVIKIPSRE